MYVKVCISMCIPLAGSRKQDLPKEELHQSLKCFHGLAGGPFQCHSCRSRSSEFQCKAAKLFRIVALGSGGGCWCIPLHRICSHWGCGPRFEILTSEEPPSVHVRFCGSCGPKPPGSSRFYGPRYSRQIVHGIGRQTGASSP